MSPSDSTSEATPNLDGKNAPQKKEFSFATEYIYVICQNGAESATKLEIMGNHPNLKLSFSRPGFITFKVESGSLPLRFTLKSTLARTYGWSLGRCQGDIAESMVGEIAGIETLQQADQVHVFERDPMLPGKNQFEPGVSPLAAEVGNLIKAAANKESINQYARLDQLVFDVVMVEPTQWWYGCHFANTTPQRWPGGVPMIDTHSEVFSRAYFKLKEALLWSGIRIQPDDLCAEIGSAPGGACQLLLEYDAKVIGIDPAEMEDEVLKDPKFTHIRRRATEVKKRDFKGVKWLITDMNTSPEATLDMISEIAEHEASNFKGLILTLKLSDWSLVKKIPEVMSRAKALGFQVIKTRQLAFNRREYCLVAVKNKFVLRDSRRKKATGKKPTGETKPTDSASKPVATAEASPPPIVNKPTESQGSA